MNKYIILLTLFLAIALYTVIASADSNWTGQTTGPVDWTTGWQNMSDGWFLGTFGPNGIYCNYGWFACFAHPITVGSDGNFSLSIPFQLNNLNDELYVGISTGSNYTDPSYWKLVGYGNCTNPSAEGFGVLPTTDEAVDNDQLDETSFLSLNYMPDPGTTYTAQIQSTDGGQTAVFSVAGQSLTLPLNGVPQYVILYIDNNGQEPSPGQVPVIYSVNFTTGPGEYSTPTPTPSPTADSYTLSLNQGWNLVSFPSVNASVPASSLDGTGVLIVSSYNRSTGDYDSYNTQVSPITSDIDMGTDTGYFIYSTNDTSIVINGPDPVDRSTTIYPGWNLIGWSSLNSSTAGDVASEPSLPGGVIISTFNAATGDYDSFAQGISPESSDFTMQDGTGYFLYSNSTAPATLYYEV